MYRMPRLIQFLNSEKHRKWRERSKINYQSRKKQKSIYYYKKKLDLLDSTEFDDMSVDDTMNRLYEIMCKRKLDKLNSDMEAGGYLPFTDNTD